MNAYEMTAARMDAISAQAGALLDAAECVHMELCDAYPDAPWGPLDDALQAVAAALADAANAAETAAAEARKKDTEMLSCVAV